MTRRLVVALMALVACGCVQDPASVQPVVPTPSAKGVYILNEGYFGQGNSALSYYDLQSFAVYPDAFKAVNGRSLGDVGNQVVLRGGRGYVVVNNSNRIEIFDAQTIVGLGTIALGSGTSPRQLAFVSDSIGLVTNLYDNSVFVLNLYRGSIEKRIPVGDNPEGIAIAGGKAVVANSGFGSGNTVTVIALDVLQAVRTLRVGENPQGVVALPDGEVCVVCGGSYGDFANPADDTPARLYFVDPLREWVTDSLLIGGHASTIALGPGGIAYVPATDAVRTVDVTRRRTIGDFVAGSYYGVAVEELTGDVYLTDVQNYAGPGKVVVFSPAGEVRTTIQVGLIPGSMAFKR